MLKTFFSSASHTGLLLALTVSGSVLAWGCGGASRASPEGMYGASVAKSARAGASGFT